MTSQRHELAASTRRIASTCMRWRGCTSHAVRRCRWAARSLALAPWLGCGEAPAGPGGPVDEGRVRTRWYVAQDGGLSYTRPTVYQNLVYLALGGGGLVARDRATGAERWRAVIDPRYELRARTTLVVQGTLVVPARYAVLGLDPATGRERWRWTPPPDWPYDPTGQLPGDLWQRQMDTDGDLVYVPAHGASVSAVDPRTGQTRWTWEASPVASDTGRFGRFPSRAEGVRVVGDTVYVNAWHTLNNAGLRSEGWVLGLDRRTGRELWRVTLPPPASGGVTIAFSGAPAVLAGGLVVTVGETGNAWGIDPRTQSVRWTRTPTARFGTATETVLRDGVLYVDGGDESLYALRASDGTQLWQVAMGNGATRDIVASASRLYYVTGGKLQILDRANGRRVAVVRTREENGLITGAPLVLDGRVYLAAADGAWVFDEP